MERGISSLDMEVHIFIFGILDDGHPDIAGFNTVLKTLNLLTYPNPIG